MDICQQTPLPHVMRREQSLLYIYRFVSNLFVGLGARVFGSGSGRFLTSLGLSGPKNLDPIGTLKFSVRVGSFRVRVISGL